MTIPNLIAVKATLWQIIQFVCAPHAYGKSSCDLAIVMVTVVVMIIVMGTAFALVVVMCPLYTVHTPPLSALQPAYETATKYRMLTTKTTTAMPTALGQRHRPISILRPRPRTNISKRGRAFQHSIVLVSGHRIPTVSSTPWLLNDKFRTLWHEFPSTSVVQAFMLTRVGHNQTLGKAG